MLFPGLKVFTRSVGFEIVEENSWIGMVILGPTETLLLLIEKRGVPQGLILGPFLFHL